MTTDAQINSLLNALKLMGVDTTAIGNEVSTFSKDLADTVSKLPASISASNSQWDISNAYRKPILDEQRMGRILSSYRAPNLYSLPSQPQEPTTITDWMQSEAARRWLSGYVWGPESFDAYFGISPPNDINLTNQKNNGEHRSPDDVVDTYSGMLNSYALNAEEQMRGKANNLLQKAAAEAFGQGKHKKNILTKEGVPSYGDYLKAALDKVSVQGNDGRTYAGRTLYQELWKQDGDNAINQMLDLMKQVDAQYDTEVNNYNMSFSNQSLQQTQLANDTDPSKRAQATNAQSAPNAGNSGWGSVGYGHGAKTSQEALRQRREGWGSAGVIA